MSKEKITKEQERRNEMLNRIFEDYGKDVTVQFHDSKRMHCYPYPSDRIIVMHVEQFFNPTNEDLFDLLHEFGHLETFKWRYRKFEEEYLATQWALDHADMYEVEITCSIINGFQKYIREFYDKAQKRGVKNLPDTSKIWLMYDMEKILR